MSALGAEVIERAVARTLQEAAFVFASRVTDAPAFEGELLEARLAWTGAVPAELRVAVGAAYAAELASNLTGDDAPDASGARDALGELLNMTAGAVVHDGVGARADCHLGVPHVVQTTPGAWSDAASGAIVALSLVDDGGQRIDVRLHAGSAR